MTNIPKILSNDLDQASKSGQRYENELNRPEVCKQIYDAFDKYGQKNIQEQRNEEVDIKDHHKENEDEYAFRKNMQEYIHTIKGTDAFGLGKIKHFHVFTGGDVGVVFKFETEDEKIYIFKTSSNVKDVITENEAGKRRSQQGANIRIAFKEGEISIGGKRHPYVILPYIDTMLKIGDLTQRERENVYRRTGENIALINKVKGRGFGHVQFVDGQFVGSEKNFKIQNTIDGVVIKDFLIENNLMEKDYLENMINKCVAIIDDEFKGREKTTLIHKDLRFINMFILPSTDGHEVLISDNSPMLGHPMEGLGMTVAKNAYLDIQGTQEEKDRLKNIIIEGYQSKGGIVNEKVMNAYIFLMLLNIGVRSYNKGKKAISKGKDGDVLINRAKDVVNLAKKISEKLN